MECELVHVECLLLGTWLIKQAHFHRHDVSTSIQVECINIESYFDTIMCLYRFIRQSNFGLRFIIQTTQFP